MGPCTFAALAVGSSPVAKRTGEGGGETDGGGGLAPCPAPGHPAEIAPLTHPAEFPVFARGMTHREGSRDRSAPHILDLLA
jgi:hypothetical protein